jgi:hypothetical protein
MRTVKNHNIAGHEVACIACLPPETRTALLAFLSSASDARRISAVSNHGDLVLSSA